ncbi:MAG: prolyl oligopeptidase family serine peptidase [Planctomycetota bacterium]
MKKTIFVIAILSLALILGCQGPTSKFNYPPARRDSVVDNYFGVSVPDPYRWLEDPDSNETLSWVNKENAITARFLDTTAREKIKKRLTNLLNYPRYSAPTKRANRYFFSKNDGLQNQAVLYFQNSLTDEPKVLINPNVLSPDGTISLGSISYSYDGKLFAYGLSQSGSDMQLVKLKNIDTLADYEDVLNYCRWPSIAIKHDNSGFFYNRFPEPGAVAKEDRFNYERVYFHRLGTPQADDPLIHQDPQNKELGFDPFISEDGKYLFLHVSHGTDPNNRIYYRPVDLSGVAQAKSDSDAPFVKLLNDADAGYEFITNDGPVFYFKTDLNAPHGRIIAIDADNPARQNWREIIPESSDILDFAGCVNNHLVIAYLTDVHHQLKIFTLAGSFVREIPLPTLGTVSGLSGNQFDTEMFLTFTSFLFPPTIYRYDIKTDQLAVFRKPEIDFDPSPYETHQFFYTSKDGTRVPLFVVHKKGLKLDGGNPTLLYAYGGFAISTTPYFSVGRIIWLEHGGVYAVANIRGGGEYGENWHRAAMKEKRQTGFDDFIAAAEFLIERKYTNTKKLAILGGSNGGLLTAVCMTQRPELYGAVVSAVPATDMLRFNKFTIGRYWIPEYGSPDDPEQFKYLYAYSPLHNVKTGVSYPPVLVTTADTDDRVVPMHSKKFVVTLQYDSAGDNPILLRVETKAGHGHGMPITKVIDEVADIYAFLFKALNIPYN